MARARRPGNGAAGARLRIAGLLLGLLALGTVTASTAVADATAPTDARPTDARPTGAAPLGGTDAAWLQLMIPMDEQALPLLDLAAARGTDPALRALAARVAGSHRAELAGLYRLRDRVGLPTANVHEGHDLPGMVLPADLAVVAALSGTAFDAAVLGLLREHLEQGVRLAAAECAAGTDPATRQLATVVEAARTADALIIVELTAIPAA
jgi:uncharacterized protein (DUF305 family)